MKIFQRYEIYDSVNNKVYRVVYTKLLANYLLKDEKKYHFFAKMRKANVN